MYIAGFDTDKAWIFYNPLLILHLLEYALILLVELRLKQPLLLVPVVVGCLVARRSQIRLYELFFVFIFVAFIVGEGVGYDVCMRRLLRGFLKPR